MTRVSLRQNDPNKTICTDVEDRKCTEHWARSGGRRFAKKLGVGKIGSPCN